MTRIRMAVVVLTILGSVLPAGAATIGVSGGDSDPQSIADPAFVLLTEGNCIFSEVPLPATYRCALYDVSAFQATGLSRLDVRLEDGTGQTIPITGPITIDPLSQLQFLSPSSLFPDGFTFALFGTPPIFCTTCVFFSSHPDGAADPAAVSSVAVNGVPNPGVPVPEPTTVLLMGMAAAGALLRWRHRAAADAVAVSVRPRRSGERSVVRS